MSQIKLHMESSRNVAGVFHGPGRRNDLRYKVARDGMINVFMSYFLLAVSQAQKPVIIMVNVEVQRKKSLLLFYFDYY